MRKPHLRPRGPHFPILDRITQYESEPGYVVFTMPVPRRLRVQVGDTLLADTVNGLMLHESDHLPTYYFPLQDVQMDWLRRSDKTTRCPYKGMTEYYSLALPDLAVENMMWRYPNPATECPDIADYAAFEWDKIDHWYEEDEEVFVHARDPFRRVDCLLSSRRVEIFLDNELIADSSHAVFLFETGLPTRYYLPLSDVREGLLQPSATVTECPYKGKANYHHVDLNGKRYEDLVWYYADPVHESARIKGMVCFGNEFVERILVDGVEEPRPQTPFSHGSD